MPWMRSCGRHNEGHSPKVTEEVEPGFGSHQQKGETMREMERDRNLGSKGDPKGWETQREVWR